MKDKIYQGLKQTFSAKYGVGDDIYLGVAESLASTGLVTDENLATVIQGQDATLKGHQANFDRWNSENSNYKKQIDELKKPNPKYVEPTQGESKQVTAEDIATLVANAIKPYSDKVSEFKTNLVAERRSAEIATIAKGCGIPESFISRLNIPSDANLNDYFKGVQQDFANIGYEGSKSPENSKVTIRTVMKYNIKPIPVNEEAARFETCYRMTGGFNLSDDKLVQGSYLPSLAPIVVDFTTRRVKAVKNVEVVEAFVSEGVSMKIKKNSLAYVGMHIGNGSQGATISAIDKANEKYDTLTITALAVDIAIGDVLFEATAVDGVTQENKANFLNYAVTKVEHGATVTAIGGILEIKKSKLQVPISIEDQESLSARFMFIL